MAGDGRKLLCHHTSCQNFGLAPFKLLRFVETRPVRQTALKVGLGGWCKRKANQCKSTDINCLEEAQETHPSQTPGVEKQWLSQMFLWCSFDFSLPRWAAHFPPADMRTVLSIGNLASSWLEVQYGQHHKNDDKEQKTWKNSNMKPCKQTYGTNSSRAALEAWPPLLMMLS